ncbi:hypothetical protein EST38_g4780 [Candolleomyces aberdarensis]|uniref:HAT C-terminal dimerisation domain-containing protein n=1 Tax=Candolleomyces aberdarensis TaxID=2316362 RepID=A0A4Q2DPH6_9AGAR|nr:hypothetical protein EST38_g4780 [Candolleomyces aberdarensis]
MFKVSDSLAPPSSSESQAPIESAGSSSEPIADTAENPFLSGGSQSPCGSSSPGSRNGALYAVARSALERPRAGLHSPSRGRHHSCSPSTSSASSVSGDDSDAGGSTASQCDSKRYDARDVWHFFKEQPALGCFCCVFCLSQAAAGTLADNEQVKHYNKKSGTGTMRRHLYGHHCNDWIAECDRRGFKIIAKSAQKHVKAYRVMQANLPQAATDDSGCGSIPDFTHEAFIDALVDFIVADDQSINVIESVFFRRLILLLCKELRDEDIPHRTSVRNHIRARWEVYMEELQTELQNSVGRISLTTDLWSDPNLRPFMAVTAHWIEAKTVKTAEGPVTNLVLRADLIAFHNVPGRHTGEHLSTALLYVLDRLKIAGKIGWITMDNASNNDTLMEHLAISLNQREITFSARDNRIWCFPHITNLACKAVLGAITNTKLAGVDDDEGDPEKEPILTAPDRDIIAHTRTLIRVIRSSSLRRDRFANIQRSLYPDRHVLELIRDVDTRWSSTLLMIERFVKLESVNKMISTNRELQKYHLHDFEWETLDAYINILRIPHAFQQKLSHEKIPTLYQALPHFHRMIAAWQSKKAVMPRYRTVIDAGIAKLEEYLDEIDDIPAYTLAIHDVLGSPITHADARSRSIHAKVEAYLADGRVGCGSTIKFWQENREEYPTIYRLTIDILPIAGSAVPCERVFSSAKETMPSRRGRILPSLMEALQMLKFSLKGSSGLNFTAGTGQEDEIGGMEGAASDAGRLPDDITSYITLLLNEPPLEDDSDEEEDKLESEIP